MVDGKARLIRDDYCDGLGDCLPACPVDAIHFVEREAAAYDEQGRLVYRHYYITHGYHYRVYLYNGEETRPWAWMEFCTQALSSPDEETGVYYGCGCFFYLFEKQEAAAG